MDEDNNDNVRIRTNDGKRTREDGHDTSVPASPTPATPPVPIQLTARPPPKKRGPKPKPKPDGQGHRSVTVNVPGVAPHQTQNTGVRPVPKTLAVRRKEWKVTFWGDRMPVENLNEFQAHIQYCVWQRERCPQTNRPHYQVYIECHTPQPSEWIRTVVFFDQDPEREEGMSRTWVEQRGRLTRKQCRYYCMKERTRMREDPDAGPFEWGVWSEPVKNGDLELVRTKIGDGVDMATLLEEHATTISKNIQGVRAMREQAAMARGREDRDITVTVVYGSPGAGKTWWVMQKAKELARGNDMSDIYILENDGGPNSRVWWDGYEQQSILIIDDYDSWISVHYLLRLLDRNMVRLQIKGSVACACWKYVFITTNIPPTEWRELPVAGQTQGDPLKGPHYEALFRRIHTVINMPQLGRMIIEKDLRNMAAGPAPSTADETNIEVKEERP